MSEQQIVTDNVLFQMPSDKELFFAAVSVVQSYVNGYADKMKVNDVSAGAARWELQYAFANTSPMLWDVLCRAGLELAVMPRLSLSSFDMVVDMSDARLMSYIETGKHACQICGIMAGVLTNALPRLRTVKPKLEGAWFGLKRSTDSVWCNNAEWPPTIGIEELLQIKDEQVTGILASGWPAYLAASMGLPVLEIVSQDKPSRWLTKWANGGYRIIHRDSPVPMHVQIERAITSIELMLYRIARVAPVQKVEDVRG